MASMVSIKLVIMQCLNFYYVKAKNTMTELAINKQVELKSSMEWIKHGFYIFREKPLQYIFFGIVCTIITFIPFFGSFLSPILLAKFVQLAKNTEENQEIEYNSLFVDLFVNPNIVRLGFINFCINGLILLVKYFSNLGFFRHSAVFIVLELLFLLLPSLILQMSMWLSPAICLNNPDITAVEAMTLSVKAGLYNIPTLIVFGLIVTVITVLALIPLCLGLLGWLPILYLSTYYTYKDMYYPS